MKEVWESTTSIDGKWNILRPAMCDNAARILGKACRRQPDWFKDNESLLLPLYLKREEYYMINGLSLD